MKLGNSSFDLIYKNISLTKLNSQKTIENRQKVLMELILSPSTISPQSQKRVWTANKSKLHRRTGQTNQPKRSQLFLRSTAKK